jgi:hypothetical protein
MSSTDIHSPYKISAGGVDLLGQPCYDVSCRRHQALCLPENPRPQRKGIFIYGHRTTGTAAIGRQGMSTYFRPGTYALVPNKHLLPQMKGAPLSVYITLCAHADAEGVCYPGIKRIMTLTGYEKDAVFRALTKLIKLGVIERTRRRTEKGDLDSNLYRILLTEVEGGSSVEATTQVRKSDYPSSAKASTGSSVEATITNPSELTHLTHRDSENEKAPGNEDHRGQPSPMADQIRETIRKRGVKGLKA